MQVYIPKCDFNAESVVLHQYDKAMNMLHYLGSMQAWHDKNVKEFWEGRKTTLLTPEDGRPITSIEQLHAMALEWYQNKTTDQHIGDMYKIADDPVLTHYYKMDDGTVRTIVIATGQKDIDEWYKSHSNALAFDVNEWYEYSTSDTYWVWNGTEWVKQPPYDHEHVGGWFYNVMNINTCNEFGLSLWAKMIGIVLPEYDQDADTDYITYYYNKLCVWRSFIKASFFRLSSNGSMDDINKYFVMIFGSKRRVVCTDMGVDGDLSDVMTVKYEVNFKATLAEDAFLMIGSPNQATEGIFPHPAGVLAKCIIGVDTGDDTDWRLGLNEHNILKNTGSADSDEDRDTPEDRNDRMEKAVQGQNLQNLNFFEEDFSHYEEFSPEKKYEVGDIVWYLTPGSAQALYRFINPHQGAWSGTDVKEVNFLRNGGYFAGDDNLDYLGLNERTVEDHDVKYRVFDEGIKFWAGEIVQRNIYKIDPDTGEYVYVKDPNTGEMVRVVVDMHYVKFINDHIGEWSDADAVMMSPGEYPENKDEKGHYLGGQDINNFDNGNIFPYDDSGEPETGPFLGLGEDASYSKDAYQYREFSAATAYSLSDKVLYKGVPYVFNQSHLGSWDATHVIPLDDKYDRATLNATKDGSDGNKTAIKN